MARYTIAKVVDEARAVRQVSANYDFVTGLESLLIGDLVDGTGAVSNMFPRKKIPCTNYLFLWQYNTSCNENYIIAIWTDLLQQKYQLNTTQNNCAKMSH
jgi:hypothetical protein